VPVKKIFHPGYLEPYGYSKRLPTQCPFASKDGAEELADYRPISLIHAIAKIISKMLADCGAVLM
jgi:hypothetical protein